MADKEQFDAYLVKGLTHTFRGVQYTAEKPRRVDAETKQALEERAIYVIPGSGDEDGDLEERCKFKFTAPGAPLKAPAPRRRRAVADE